MSATGSNDPELLTTRNGQIKIYEKLMITDNHVKFELSS